MAKEKKVIFEEMSMVEDTPDDLVMELFTEAFWPDHPLGRPILGNARRVGGFDRDELARVLQERLPRRQHPDLGRRALDHAATARPGAAAISARCQAPAQRRPGRSPHARRHGS